MIFRRKLRYVLVEASDDVSMADPRNADALRAGTKAFLGELTYFKANPQITAQLENRFFVIGVNRGYERSVVLALSFIKELDGRRVGFYTLKTSGTIRSLKDYFAGIRGAR
ncbi:MAG: Rpp14/Pop5 family protein [Candidatus Micrarchaeota archaeon]|nr:Rpp14/Pop5 family protein [Candidatus Micrarchaeota archaeon]